MIGAAGTLSVEARQELDRIDQLGVTVLRDWLAADRARDRAAGDYYLSRLSRNSLTLPFSDTTFVPQGNPVTVQHLRTQGLLFSA